MLLKMTVHVSLIKKRKIMFLMMTPQAGYRLRVNTITLPLRGVVWCVITLKSITTK